MNGTMDLSVKVVQHIDRLERCVSRRMPLPEFEDPFPELSKLDAHRPLDTTEVHVLIRKMALSVGLTGYSFLVYAESLESGVGGRIEWPNNESGGTAYIEVDPRALRHYNILVKILSHELAHQYLRHHNVVYEDHQLNELMTDVTSVLLGFGKYILNGSRVEETERDLLGNKTVTTWSVGYLSSSEFAYVYKLSCALAGASQDQMMEGLSASSRASLNLFDARGYILPASGGVVESCELASKKFDALCDEEDLAFAYAEFMGRFSSVAAKVDIDKIASLRKEQVVERGSVEQFVHSIRTASSPNLANVLLQAKSEHCRECENEISRRMRALEVALCQLAGDQTENALLRSWALSVEQGKITISCPRCAASLRLPAAIEHLAAKCPKCSYSFDYSTLPPHCPGLPKKRASATGRRNNDKLGKRGLYVWDWVWRALSFWRTGAH